QPDLVLDLTLLPARGWRASDGLNKIMAAHLREATVVVPRNERSHRTAGRSKSLVHTQARSATDAFIVIERRTGTSSISRSDIRDLNRKTR
ncbi:MAG TPA: hypothetical protein VGC31_06400, partial [Paenirhodobacter sp.]